MRSWWSSSRRISETSYPWLERRRCKRTIFRTHAGLSFQSRHPLIMFWQRGFFWGMRPTQWFRFMVKGWTVAYRMSRCFSKSLMSIWFPRLRCLRGSSEPWKPTQLSVSKIAMQYAIWPCIIIKNSAQTSPPCLTWSAEHWSAGSTGGLRKCSSLSTAWLVSRPSRIQKRSGNGVDKPPAYLLLWVHWPLSQWHAFFGWYCSTGCYYGVLTIDIGQMLVKWDQKTILNIMH